MVICGITACSYVSSHYSLPGKVVNCLAQGLSPFFTLSDCATKCSQGLTLQWRPENHYFTLYLWKYCTVYKGNSNNLWLDNKTKYMLKQ